MSSVLIKTCLSQTWWMSLKGQKVKLSNLPSPIHVRHVCHIMASRVHNATAMSEIMAFETQG